MKGRKRFLLSFLFFLPISAFSSLTDMFEKIEAEFDVSMETKYEPIGKTQRALAGRIAGAGTLSLIKLETREILQANIRTHFYTMSGSVALPGQCADEY